MPATSTSPSTLVILGAGGHGRVVADAALAQGRWRRVVATDADPARWHGELLPGVALLPLAEAMALDGAQIHIAIGRAAARVKEFAALQAHAFASVVHPAAAASAFAQVGLCTFIAAQAVVAPQARIGHCVIVNHGAVVDHDCEVGDFAHIAPQAALGGGVRVGARVLVGSGARILPGLAIADDVILGAGAVVTRSIAEPGTYAGLPARRIA
ncbi:NeuD/PglB/VioB family sugar acetyltransferase [Ramlibacter sp.]|uniref:NeuD/PglB/VioB family sugar acetyltransferase n=1 Tax=Ramlibacter sp. TaxID=1917967 RepID=UPI003D147D7D